MIRHTGCPLVFWAHDVMSGRHWTERLARRATPDLAICNSHFTRRSLDMLYPRVPSVVVYAPVELPRAADDVVRLQIRASVETPPDSVVIVQACRSEEWKGHEQLLDALVALRSVPGWIWWQIGGAQRPHERTFLARLRDKAVRAGIGGRIRWLGERSDVGPLLTAADLYCQPNLEPEPFGIAFIEALGAGLPVVTTRQGAAEEILDATCGVLVPPRQPAVLADDTARVVTDVPRRHQLAAQARARAQNLCEPARQMECLTTTLSADGPRSSFRMSGRDASASRFGRGRASARAATPSTGWSLEQSSGTTSGARGCSTSAAATASLRAALQHRFTEYRGLDAVRYLVFPTRPSSRTSISIAKTGRLHPAAVTSSRRSRQSSTWKIPGRSSASWPRWPPRADG